MVAHVRVRATRPDFVALEHDGGLVTTGGDVAVQAVPGHVDLAVGEPRDVTLLEGALRHQPHQTPPNVTPPPRRRQPGAHHRTPTVARHWRAQLRHAHTRCGPHLAHSREVAEPAQVFTGEAAPERVRIRDTLCVQLVVVIHGRHVRALRHAGRRGKHLIAGGRRWVEWCGRRCECKTNSEARRATRSIHPGRDPTQCTSGKVDESRIRPDTQHRQHHYSTGRTTSPRQPW